MPDQDVSTARLLGYVSKNVLLAIYVLFALFPLIWMVILSLKPDSEMFNTTFIFHPTFENFRVVLTRADFLGALQNNVIICVCAVLLSMVVGVPAAYALARFQFKGREDIAFTFL